MGLTYHHREVEMGAPFNFNMNYIAYFGLMAKSCPEFTDGDGKEINLLVF
jgi:hypothetical protein